MPRVESRIGAALLVLFAGAVQAGDSAAPDTTDGGPLTIELAREEPR